MVKLQTSSLRANAFCRLLSRSVETHSFSNGNELSNAICLPPIQDSQHTDSNMAEGLPTLCFFSVQVHEALMPVQTSIKCYFAGTVVFYI